MVYVYKVEETEKKVTVALQRFPGRQPNTQQPRNPQTQLYPLHPETYVPISDLFLLSLRAFRPYPHLVLPHLTSTHFQIPFSNCVSALSATTTYWPFSVVALTTPCHSRAITFVINVFHCPSRIRRYFRLSSSLILFDCSIVSTRCPIFHHEHRSPIFDKRILSASRAGEKIITIRFILLT